MRILVTGAAGFIGSHLSERLISDGHTVVGVDDLSTGLTDNVRHLKGPRFRFVKADVLALPRFKVDAIYHLACPASPVGYQADPVKTTLTSVMGTYNCLSLASKTGARLLFTSTSEVYGEPAVHPQTESYWGFLNPVGTRSCYSESKRCAESLCNDFQRLRLADVRVARIFNTYGPRMSIGDGRVVSNFIVQSLAGRPLAVFGDGMQTRSFCYISDIVEGLVRLMNSGRYAGAVNLGNPVEFTILTLAKMILAMTGSNSPIVHGPRPPDDPSRRKPDISKAWKLLRWRPQVDLKVGMTKSIDYYRRLSQ